MITKKEPHMKQESGHIDAPVSYTHLDVYKRQVEAFHGMDSMLVII